MRMTISRRWLAFGIAAVAIAGSATLATGVATGGDPGTVPPRIPESDPTPTAPPAEDETVPARTIAPADADCRPDDTFFDNPVLHVGVCVPPGWGFSDFTAPDPMERIPIRQLTNLHLLSPDAFPWQVGTASFGAVARGIVDVEFTVLERGARAVSECEPSTKRAGNGPPYLFCEQAYDALGEPADAGPITALKIIVPLKSDPKTSFDLTGARLLVIARVATGDAEGVEAAWSIVDRLVVS